MTEPPTVPSAGLFYGGDLAYVHDAAFGHLARGGARMLLRLLGRVGIRNGLVTDLGAGSGITARVLTDAGYQVLGVELSPDMVELARRRTPAARFVRSSLLDADLPACVAVTAIGECLNYAADPRAGRRQLVPLFARIHQALEPGGLFLFDVAEPGRERRTPRRTWHEGPGWLLCVEAAEAPDERVLRRRITVFRQANGAWRRSDELHSLRLYPRQDLLDLLASTGFHTRLLAGYGSAARFRRGHAGILAIKPSDEKSLNVQFRRHEAAGTNETMGLGRGLLVGGTHTRYCSRVCQNRSSVAAFRARRAS